MKVKHTPGPWLYDETWGLITATEKHVEIAAVHAARSKSSAKANARLIAAAPDMLAELKRVVKDCDCEGSDKDDHSACTPCVRIYKLIARAESRE